MYVEDDIETTVRNLIMEQGTEEQQLHLESGAMAWEDQLLAARDIMYSAIGAWPRFTQASNSHVRRELAARGECNESDPINWETVPSVEVSSEQRMRLEWLQGLVPFARVEPMDHVARCGSGVFRRTTAQVVIDLAGQPSMREYRLDTDPETERLFAPLREWPLNFPAADHQFRELLRRRGNACSDYDPVIHEVVVATEIAPVEHQRLQHLREKVPEAEVRAVWVVSRCNGHALKRTAGEVAFNIYTGTVRRNYRLNVDVK